MEGGHGGVWNICFYGIERSLRFTYGSIVDHILRPCQEQDEKYRLLAHFNLVDCIDQVRTGERNVKLARDDIALLNPDILWAEPQSEKNIMDQLTISGIAYKGTASVYQDSHKYLLHQLHSLRRLSQLLDLTRNTGGPLFGVFRADLQYIDPIPFPLLESLLMSGEVDVAIPSWDAFGGANDRFFIANSKATKVLLNRIDLVQEFVMKNGYIHAEELMQFALDRNHLRVIHVNVRAERVRANGYIPCESFFR